MTYISNTLRGLISERASGRCEYCFLPSDRAFPSHEVDHIYAEKHGGQTTEDNLCLSCFDCNRYKGSDICSIDVMTGDVVALFHPRRDKWADHFVLDGAIIRPLTSHGRVAIRLLHLNDNERVLERSKLIQQGRYP